MTYCYVSGHPTFRHTSNESSRSGQLQFRPLHHQGSASFTICKCIDLKLSVDVSTNHDSHDFISFNPTSSIHYVFEDTMQGIRPSQPLTGKVFSEL